MSIATKLGLAFGAQYSDPFRSKRGSLWMDRSYYDSAWKLNAEAACTHVTPPQPVSTPVAVPAAQANTEISSPVANELTAARAADGAADPVTLDIQPVQLEIPPTQMLPILQKVESKVLTTQAAVPLRSTETKACQAEVTGTASIGVGTDAPSTPVKANIDSPVGSSVTTEKVIDEIHRKIQLANVHAVALDDLHHQLTRHEALLEQNIQLSCQPPALGLKANASTGSSDLESVSKRELAIHLYTLRNQVEDLFHRVEAREQQFDRQIANQRKEANKKKLTVHIVKDYDEDPVPYRKPPFARMNDAITDTTSSFIATTASTSTSSSRARGRNARRRNSSSILTELNVELESPYSTSTSFSSSTHSIATEPVKSIPLSSVTSSNSSISEAAAKAFWARRQNPPPRPISSTETSTSSSYR